MIDIIMILLSAALLIVAVFYYRKKRKGERVVEVNYVDGIISLRQANGTLTRFTGDGTAWYELPYMRRCDTDEEYLLVEMVEYINRFGNPYPTAHTKKTQP